MIADRAPLGEAAVELGEIGGEAQEEHERQATQAFAAQVEAENPYGIGHMLEQGGFVTIGTFTIMLIIVGMVLSLPGVPGQGLLTILLGVMLMQIPGKRRLERRIISIGIVQRATVRVRQRFGRPPFDLRE